MSGSLVFAGVPIRLASVTTTLKDGTFFATAHMFCAFRDGPKKLGFVTEVPAKTEIFLHGLQLTTRKKQVLARG